MVHISKQSDVYNMNKTMNITVAILFTSLFWACEKPDPTPIDPPADVEEVLEIEWTTRLDNNKSIVNLADGISYKEWYLYPGDLDDPPTIFAFNKDTGEKDWTLILDQLPGYEITYMFLEGDIIVARNGYLVFGLDLDTKEVIWQMNFHAMGINLGRGIIASNGKYYQIGTFNFNPSGGGVAHMYEIDPHTGDYRQIYAKAPDSLGTKTVSPPTIFDDEDNNRQLLVFNEYPDAEVPPDQGGQYLVALDLNTLERVWESNVTDIFASNSLHPPIVYDNRIAITGGHNSIYGFDITTGEKLWEYEDENSLGLGQWVKTNHLIHGDRLYINENGEDVSCLNPETGELIWDNIKGGANCTDNMHYYEKEDLLVFTSWGYGSVMVLDAFTGKTLHREYEYEFSSFNNDVVFDEERDLFITSTYKHVVAFKVQRQ